MNSKNTITQTITHLALDALQPSPVNQRSWPKKNGTLRELADNIGSLGLLHPVTVRKRSGSKNQFEIVAGERRFRACKLLKWETMPAIIRELSDKEAEEITATENLQREDLSPLEEAQSVNILLKDGRDPKEIADRLGKPVRWIIRRAKLIDLCPAWRKAFADPENPISKWSASHLERIARYAPEKQVRILKAIDEEWRGEIATISTKDLEKNLQEGTRALSSAPWKLNDESIVPSAGACLVCSSRSSSMPDLFDIEQTKKGGEKDYCLSDICWGKKLIAFNTAKLAVLKEKHKDLVLISNNGPQQLPSDNPWKSQTHDAYDFKDSSKKNKKIGRHQI